MIIQKSHGRVVNETSAPREKFKMVAKTMVSLEEVLADELRALGAENVEILNRAVEFEGDMRMLYRANYSCRTALAILKPFAEFDANDDQELYEKVYKIRWEKMLDCDGTFMIDSTTSGEVFTHSYYAALKTKDAIVDRFRRNFGKRPSIDTEEPDYKINLHIRDNHVTLLMNSSGDSLHKRGYRQGVGVAPINEVLAAYRRNTTGATASDSCGGRSSTWASGRASRLRRTARLARSISMVKYGVTTLMNR